MQAVFTVEIIRLSFATLLAVRFLENCRERGATAEIQVTNQRFPRENQCGEVHADVILSEGANTATKLQLRPECRHRHSIPKSEVGLTY